MTEAAQPLGVLSVFLYFPLVKPREVFLLCSKAVLYPGAAPRGDGTTAPPSPPLPSLFQVPVTLSLSSSPGGPWPSHRGFIVLSASS